MKKDKYCLYCKENALLDRQKKFCSMKCYQNFCKINKIGCFYNYEQQSFFGKKGGHVVQAILKAKGLSFYGREIYNLPQSKAAYRQSGLNTTKYMRENKLGWFSNDPKVQKSRRWGGRLGAKKMYFNRNTKVFDLIFDSIPEAQVGLSIMKQFKTKLKEGKSLHVKIGFFEYDYFIRGMFIEYHPSMFSRGTHKNYYKTRRKNLDVNGYKENPLVIIK